jgi:hypothetical protein
MLLHGCRSRQNKKMNKHSDLTIRDLLMLYPKDGNCPVLGFPLLLTVYEKRRNNTPSIDKIIPKKGYMFGNVRIISWLANRIKSDKISPDKFLEKAKQQYFIYKSLAAYIKREIPQDQEMEAMNESRNINTRRKRRILWGNNNQTRFDFEQQNFYENTQKQGAVKAEINSVLW